MDKRFDWTRKDVITMLATERLIFDNIKKIHVWANDVDIYVGGSRNIFNKAIKRLIERFDEVFSSGHYDNGYIYLFFTNDFAQKEDRREFFQRNKDEYWKMVDDAIARVDKGMLGETTTRTEIYAERRLEQYNEDLTHAHGKYIPKEMFREIMWFLFRDDPKVLEAYHKDLLNNKDNGHLYVWGAFHQLVNSYLGMHGISTCADRPISDYLTKRFFIERKKLPQ